MHRLCANGACELSEAQLRQHFMQYGAVANVFLPRHSSGRSRGFAFVTFTLEQALSNALVDTEPVVHGVVLKVRNAKAAVCSKFCFASALLLLTHCKQA